MEYDYYPLQVTEFNTGIKAAQELRQIYIEGNGGDNDSESYPAAWLFAARKTNPMSLEYGKKGILFTMGDELYPEKISVAHMQQHLGISNNYSQRPPMPTTTDSALSTVPSSSITQLFSSSATALSAALSSSLTKYAPTTEIATLMQASSVASRRSSDDALSALLGNRRSSTFHNEPRLSDMSTEEILKEVQQKYEVFHLVLKADASAIFGQYNSTFNSWKKLLGDKAIPVKTNDIGKVAEIIVSIIDRYYARKTPQQVALTWQDRDMQLAVQSSLANLGTLAIVPQPVASTVTSNDAPQFMIQDQSANTFLIENGFSIDSRRINNFISSGHTPLTLAITNGDYSTSYKLVQAHNADLNAKLQNGDTALHIALRRYDQPGYKAIVEWLVSSGANLDLSNQRGMTPRRLAQKLKIPLPASNASRLIPLSDAETRRLLIENPNPSETAAREDSWCWPSERCYIC